MNAITPEYHRDLIGFASSRKADYQLCFKSPAGQRVLGNLAPFCCASDPTLVTAPNHGPVDIHRTMILIGRRDVWLRIQNHLNLTPEQLYALYDGRAVQIGE